MINRSIPKSKKECQRELDEIKKIAIPILKKNKITTAGIFGSYALGKAKKRSDVDILIKPKKHFSLLDLVGLKFELEKSLNKKVDILTYSSINPLIRQSILESEIRII